VTEAAAQGDASTFTQLITMTVKPEEEQRFLETARRGVELVQANEPRVLLYVLTRHPDRAHTFVWVERYADEAAREHHGSMSYMAELLSVVRDCLAAPPERLVLEQLEPA
jgi:quinol monooxygenase YgiN